MFVRYGIALSLALFLVITFTLFSVQLLTSVSSDPFVENRTVLQIENNDVVNTADETRSRKFERTTPVPRVYNGFEHFKHQGVCVYPYYDLPIVTVSEVSCGDFCSDDVSPIGYVSHFHRDHELPEIIYRSVPVMPDKATKSGRCQFSVIVGEDGHPIKLSSLKCSDKIFEKSTIQASMKWIFRQKVENGKRVKYESQTQRLIYRLVDEGGIVIPE